MKRVVWPLILFSLGMATIYYYQTNYQFKTKLNNWLGVAKYDSLGKTTDLDTAGHSTQLTKKQKTRERIPKVLEPGKFDQLDKYARNTPEKHAKNLKDLASYLMIPAKSDIDKARLAFTWVASHIQYDARAYNTGKYNDEFSANSVLKKRTAVCEGYSTLFMELALMMNLEVVKISGYAKGYGLKIKKFDKSNHAWNAVKLNNSWQLIDATWGSGYGINKNNKMESVMEFDPYWFCVNPYESIFSHLPGQQDWQLIQNPINLSQFERLPDINKSLFELGYDGEEVFEAALSGRIEEFVETYPTDFPVTKVELPLMKVINRGKEYTFILQSAYVEETAIIDGTQWIYLKKENEKFSTTYIPVNESLEIAVKYNWFDTQFTLIAKYEIGTPKI